MSSEALQMLQISAVTLACLSGLFGEPHRSAMLPRANTKFLFGPIGVYFVLVVLAI